MPYYGDFSRTYTYAEGKGVFVRAIARFIHDGTLKLLPIRAPSFELLNRAGVIKRGLVGWPQQFVIDIGMPEGFFRQADPWTYTFNPSGNTPITDFTLYDPAAVGDLPARPDIVHAYEQMVRYDVSRYGMRFAVNLYDRVRLGPAMFNTRLKENLERRIDTYALQLNKMIWANSVQTYHADSSNTTYSPGFETLGSIPFYFNGLICRFGLVTTSATRPTSLTGNEQIVALTFHDGDFVNTPAPLFLGTQGGTSYYIHWSRSAVFYHPDLVGKTVGQLVDTSFSTPGSYGRRHVIGTHERGTTFNTPLAIFNHGASGVETNPANVLTGVYWQIFTPYLLSSQWDTTIPTTTGVIDPIDTRRLVAAYRLNKMPAAVSMKQNLQIENNGANVVETYPIYGNLAPSNGVTGFQGWYAIVGTGTAGGQKRVDTRFPVTASVFEQCYYAMRFNSNGVGPRLLFCRPEIQSALNIYAMTNATLFRKLGEGSHSEELKLGTEWDQYKDAAVFVDLSVPDGVVYMGVLNDKTLQFAFDDKNFEVFHVPTPNDVDYFHGRFAMKMMMINPQSWGLIWGVRA